MAPLDVGMRALSRSASVAIFPRTETVCLSCRHMLHQQRQQRQFHRRHYASSSAATAPSSAPPETSSPSSVSSPSKPSSPPAPHPDEQQPAIRPAYQLHAGILLSRPPFLTRDLTPFEKAFYLYQRRLNERLALPFTRYFYFKKGTPADLEWKRKMRERLTPARDIGVYNAYAADGWNDELLLGDETSEPEAQMEALLRDAESPDAVAEEGLGEVPTAGDERTDKAKADMMVKGAAGKKDAVERPASRISEADRTGDLTSLDRLGWRSLYLLVRDKESGRWRFPSARLIGRESLHQAAERAIVQTAGPNMNTWVVGNAPIGHYATEYKAPFHDAERATAELGEKVFFLRARIMAGQASIRGNEAGVDEFRWLAKEEVRETVGRGYWAAVQDMMPER